MRESFFASGMRARMGGRRRVGLLLSTSVAALLIGGGAPAAFGQCYTGPFPFTNSGPQTCITVSGTSFSGNVVNSATGVITPGSPNGILVTNSSSIAGQISNAGTISITGPGAGIMVDTNSIITNGIVNQGLIQASGAGIVVDGVATFGGGISNSGTITGGSAGIAITHVDTFSGGITNSGAISAFNQGIDICSCVTNFLGGITNIGLIAASGVGISVSVSNFSNGITNFGTILANTAGIAVVGVSVFNGGISNAGTIVASSPAGIFVLGVATFLNGITNSGTISAPSGNGIFVAGVDTFSGNIVNSGTIAAGNVAPTIAAIRVAGVATFQGAIVNSSSGTLSGAVGIAVSGVSVFGTTSPGGGIVNQGLIQVSGNGIAVNGVAAFNGGITNSGTLVNTSFTGASISVDGVDRFSGGIVNSGSGTISGFGAGIVVCNCVTTFLDGIVNAGLIAANSSGIVVAASVFRGGITNSGAISVTGGFASGTGIAVRGVATFADGITNTGLISAAGGFLLGGSGGVGIAVVGVGEFSGGIENGSTGTIMASPASGAFSAPPVGIQVTGVSLFNGDIVNRGVINAATSPTPTGIGIQVSRVSTFNGNIINAGTITAALRGIEVSGSTSSGVGQMTFTGGITNAGLIAIAQSGSSVGISIDGVSVFSGGVRNSGTITGAGIGIEICGCVLTFAGGVTNTGLIAANFGGISVSATSFFGNLSNAGTITVTGTNPSAAGILITGTTFVDGHIVNTGTISAPLAYAIDLAGAGSPMIIDQNGGLLEGIVRLSPNGDTLNVRGGTINGNIVGQNVAGEMINFLLGTGSFTYAAAYGFTNVNQVNVSSGVVILNGVNQATNVAVNGGVLQVGDAANTGASLTSTVDVIGGTLSGHGTIAGDVTIENGGILFPGGSIGTLTITNSLTFNAGSFYAVQIAPGAGNNSATLVTGGAGTATINGGTVTVIPQLGHYNATQYTIVTATGGVTGTFTSSTPTFVGPFAFTGSATLSYDPNDVFLNLGNGFVILNAPNANQNQQSVLNGINNAILSNQTLPPQFQNLGNLSGSGLLNALSQLSGETGAGFLQGAFQSGDLFLNLMVNPFIDGRFGAGGGFGAAMGFAAEEPPAMPQAALAFASAMPTKAPPLGIATSASAAYRVWGSAYGGAESVDGNAVVGSQKTTSRAFGFAAGVDYPIAPTTTLGFALAGGGTNWGLEGGLGSGHSDMFQAGAYGSHRWGAAYVSGALSYNFHDVTTDRTVTVAGVDRLTAGFQAHGIGARFEGGYRYATPWLGITPYGAVQVQSIFLPNYGETATAGSNQFALNFASQTATATRTELGAWLDKSTLLSNGALLTLYGRAAWAHDFGNTRAVSAIFQGLPGSNFVVNGAAPAPDSALVTAGALYRLMNRWSFQAKFDGEFSSTTNVYSGTGVVKKVW
jgi:uncharacterized protein with beta-barrel porin domain